MRERKKNEKEKGRNQRSRREKKKEREYFLNERGERNLIYIYILALMNNAHLFIDVHCSNGVKKKKKRFSPTTGA